MTEALGPPCDNTLTVNPFAPCSNSPPSFLPSLTDSDLSSASDDLHPSFYNRIDCPLPSRTSAAPATLRKPTSMTALRSTSSHLRSPNSHVPPVAPPTTISSSGRARMGTESKRITHQKEAMEGRKTLPTVHPARPTTVPTPSVATPGGTPALARKRSHTILNLTPMNGLLPPTLSPTTAPPSISQSLEGPQSSPNTEPVRPHAERVNDVLNKLGLAAPKAKLSPAPTSKYAGKVPRSTADIDALTARLAPAKPIYPTEPASQPSPTSTLPPRPPSSTSFSTTTKAKRCALMPNPRGRSTSASSGTTQGTLLASPPSSPCPPTPTQTASTAQDLSKLPVVKAAPLLQGTPG